MEKSQATKERHTQTIHGMLLISIKKIQNIEIENIAFILVELLHVSEIHKER